MSDRKLTARVVCEQLGLCTDLILVFLLCIFYTVKHHRPYFVGGAMNSLSIDWLIDRMTDLMAADLHARFLCSSVSV